MRRRYLTLPLVTLIAVNAMGAQQTRGTVRDSIARVPLAGAVIVVLDSSGRTAARTIADRDGRFSVPLTGSSAVVRAIRIGYRPREVALTHSRADSAITLSMLSVSMLDAVKVGAAELCPGSSERGAAFTLWEQARFGLLASIVAREARPADMASISFERSIWPNDSLVHEQTVEHITGRTTRSFIATAAPSTFAANGYIVETDGTRVYSAPDADVLLDGTFAETHCFRLRAADASHADQVGVTFAPIAGRDALVDVTGVIWIGRTVPALRSLEFRYTGLEPAATRANAGGYLEFRAMPNGVVFIEHWSLRLPIMKENAGTVAVATADPRLFGGNSKPPSRRRQERANLRVSDIRETGGQVMRASWDDGSTWEAPPSGLAGTVVQQGTNLPVPFAIVTLVGTADSAVANAAGEFTLAPSIPGRYSVQTLDTAFSGFARERSETKVYNVARGSILSIQPELSTRGNVLANLCQGRQASRANTTTVLGHVSMIGQSETKNEVVATWTGDKSDTTGAPAGNALNAVVQVAPIDASGHFLLCGVATERALRLRMREARGTEADTTIFLSAVPVTRFEWRRPPGLP